MGWGERLRRAGRTHSRTLRSASSRASLRLRRGGRSRIFRNASHRFLSSTKERRSSSVSAAAVIAASNKNWLTVLLTWVAAICRVFFAVELTRTSILSVFEIAAGIGKRLLLLLLSSGHCPDKL